MEVGGRQWWRRRNVSTGDDLSSPYKISSLGVSDHGKEIIMKIIEVGKICLEVE